jgi:hypothetical protein
MFSYVYTGPRFAAHEGHLQGGPAYYCAAYSGPYIVMPKRPREQLTFHDLHQYVVNAFQALGQHGKPTEGQRTVLAAMVLFSCDSGPRLLSLATGTKCLPENLRCNQGKRINDSHAEVLARRCAVRWLNAEFRRTLACQREGAIHTVVQG